MGCSPTSSREPGSGLSPQRAVGRGRFERIPRPLSVDSIKCPGPGSGPWVGRLRSGDSGVGLRAIGELACSRGLWNLVLLRCWVESGAYDSPAARAVEAVWALT